MWFGVGTLGLKNCLMLIFWTFKLSFDIEFLPFFGYFSKNVQIFSNLLVTLLPVMGQCV
jgi:hypothetical protein